MGQREGRSLTDAVITLHREKPVYTRLRGRYREHFIMKLRVGPETEMLAEKFAEMSREQVPGVDTYFEYNPTAML